MITAEAGTKIAGYTYQFQRALYRLFSSVHGNILIGVETGDDVVELRMNEDGTIVAVFEQDKHTIKEGGQPYADGSKNLWHTIHIWLHSAERAKEQYREVRYCLVTNKPVPDKAMARRLSDATAPEDVDACIAEIREKSAETDENDKSEIDAVSGFDDESLRFVIGRIELVDSSGTVDGVPLKDATIHLFHLTDDLIEKGEDIYRGLLGQLVDCCQSAWVNREPAWLQKAPFAERLQSEINAYRVDRYLERSLASIAWRDYHKGDAKDLLFIAQLQHLQLSDDYCTRALSHYWSFYSERIRLLQAGIVLQRAWNARDGALHQRWQSIRDEHLEFEEVADTGNSMTAAKRIARDTLSGDHRAPLGGRETSEPYFTLGHYHDLANRQEDDVFVYWHDAFAPSKDDSDGGAS
ncbi:ABC-three component system protein [Burkholderia ambifaria]|uniref:ABC-three component system protein n=1 Tax=Burkholderia ambifaria TaxID=152480 RepID=UPI00158EF538|nr:ABC-three component system protein [Burkholderia ambifaria]